MQRRIHVPFDVFGMREAVRVSTLVRVGARGWTCGQCPLDGDGQVVAPDDLHRQAVFVAEMIKTVFARAGFTSRDAAMLVIYYAGDPGDDAHLRGIFAEHFPSAPALCLIPLPHFYYEGMLIEVDAFADATLEPSLQPQRSSFHVREGAEHVYLGLSTSSFEAASAALADLELKPTAILCEHWAHTEEHVGSRPSLAAVPEASLLTPSGSENPISAGLILARAPVSRVQDSTIDAVELTLHRAGKSCVYTALCSDPAANMVEQTHRIMRALDAALIRQGQTWKNVVKVSAPYRGGASEAALHDNLKIRHSFHALPGPASTGLPVHGFADPGPQIVVQVTALD